MLNDITVVVAIDAHHLKELEISWHTWMAYKHDLRAARFIIIYDQSQIDPRSHKMFCGYNVKFYPWDMPNVSQREKMLTALVHVPAREVTTSWYLKLDTDTVATAPGKWIDDGWFKPDIKGRPPVYISHRWHYSKPSNVLKILDDWGDTLEPFRSKPRLNIPFDPKSGRVYSNRIISWCFFGNTEWTRNMSRLAGYRLPCPSQDTFLYYCAARLGEYTVATNMKRYNWDHVRYRKLIEIGKNFNTNCN